MEFSESVSDAVNSVIASLSRKSLETSHSAESGDQSPARRDHARLLGLMLESALATRDLLRCWDEGHVGSVAAESLARRCNVLRVGASAGLARRADFDALMMVSEKNSKWRLRGVTLYKDRIALRHADDFGVPVREVPLGDSMRFDKIEHKSGVTVEAGGTVLTLRPFSHVEQMRFLERLTHVQMSTRLHRFVSEMSLQTRLKLARHLDDKGFLFELTPRPVPPGRHHRTRRAYRQRTRARSRDVLVQSGLISLGSGRSKRSDAEFFADMLSEDEQDDPGSASDSGTAAKSSLIKSRRGHSHVRAASTSPIGSLYAKNSSSSKGDSKSVPRGRGGAVLKRSNSSSYVTSSGCAAPRALPRYSRGRPSAILSHSLHVSVRFRTKSRHDVEILCGRSPTIWVHRAPRHNGYKQPVPRYEVFPDALVYYQLHPHRCEVEMRVRLDVAEGGAEGAGAAPSMRSSRGASQSRTFGAASTSAWDSETRRSEVPIKVIFRNRSDYGHFESLFRWFLHVKLPQFRNEVLVERLCLLHADLLRPAADPLVSTSAADIIDAMMEINLRVKRRASAGTQHIESLYAAHARLPRSRSAGDIPRVRLLLQLMLTGRIDTPVAHAAAGAGDGTATGRSPTRSASRLASRPDDHKCLCSKGRCMLLVYRMLAPMIPSLLRELDSDTGPAAQGPSELQLWLLKLAWKVSDRLPYAKATCKTVIPRAKLSMHFSQPPLPLEYYLTRISQRRAVTEKELQVVYEVLVGQVSTSEASRDVGEFHPVIRNPAMLPVLLAGLNKAPAVTQSAFLMKMMMMLKNPQNVQTMCSQHCWQNWLFPLLLAQQVQPVDGLRGVHLSETESESLDAASRSSRSAQSASPTSKPNLVPSTSEKGKAHSASPPPQRVRGHKTRSVLSAPHRRTRARRSRSVSQSALGLAGERIVDAKSDPSGHGRSSVGSGGRAGMGLHGRSDSMEWELSLKVLISIFSSIHAYDIVFVANKTLRHTQVARSLKLLRQYVPWTPDARSIACMMLVSSALVLKSMRRAVDKERGERGSKCAFTSNFLHFSILVGQFVFAMKSLHVAPSPSGRATGSGASPPPPTSKFGFQTDACGHSTDIGLVDSVLSVAKTLRVCDPSSGYSATTASNLRTVMQHFAALRSELRDLGSAKSGTRLLALRKSWTVLPFVEAALQRKRSVPAKKARSWFSVMTLKKRTRKPAAVTAAAGSDDSGDEFFTGFAHAQATEAQDVRFRGVELARAFTQGRRQSTVSAEEVAAATRKVHPRTNSVAHRGSNVPAPRTYGEIAIALRDLAASRSHGGESTPDTPFSGRFATRTLIEMGESRGPRDATFLGRKLLELGLLCRVTRPGRQRRREGRVAFGDSPAEQYFVSARAVRVYEEGSASPGGPRSRASSTRRESVEDDESPPRRG